MKLFLMTLLIFPLVLAAQPDAPIVSVCGKDYEITGSFLTIIIADNLTYGKPETLAPAIIERMQATHRQKITALEAQKASLSISEKTLQDTLRVLEQQLAAAEQQVYLLVREFESVDLKTTSYLYQLAYYFFRNGQLKEALEVMSEEALAKLEYNQGIKYVRRARLLEEKGDIASAKNSFEKAASRYPSFLTKSAYGKHLFHHHDTVAAMAVLNDAIGLAGSVGERSHGCFYLMKSHLATDDLANAKLAAAAIMVIKDHTGHAVPEEQALAEEVLATKDLSVLEKAEKLLVEKRFAAFDKLMHREKVQDYEMPFSEEAYQLKLIYLEGLKITNPEQVKREKKKIKRFYKKKLFREKNP